MKSKILKKILSISVPTAIDLSSQTIMWTVEIFIVGFLSASAIAGVGISSQILLLTVTLFGILVLGTSVLINRHIGSAQQAEADHVFGQAFSVMFLISIVVGISCYFGADAIFSAIGAKEEVVQSGALYLRTVSVFSPFVLVNFFLLGIARGSGDNIKAMRINIMINSLNMILAFVLTFGLLGFPRFEVKGTALALGISHTTGFLFTSSEYLGRRMKVVLHVRDVFLPDAKTLKRILKIGVPTSIEQFAYLLGQLFITSLAARMGVVSVAVHQVLIKIQGLFSMLFHGFGWGATIMVGQDLGGEKLLRAEKSYLMATKITLWISFAVAAVFIFFGEQLIYMFSRNADILAIGSKVMIITGLVQIPKAMNITITGGLRGAGDVLWLMCSMIAGVVLFQFFGGYLLGISLEQGLYGLWTAMGLDELFRAYINWGHRAKERWKYIKV